MRHARLKNSTARRAWLKLALTRVKPANEPRLIAQPRDAHARVTPVEAKT